MVREDGDWRIDDLSVPLLRTLVEAGFEQTENLPPGGVDCLQEGVRAIPDAQFRALAYMLVGEQPGSQRRIFELLARARAKAACRCFASCSRAGWSSRCGRAARARKRSTA